MSTRRTLDVSHLPPFSISSNAPLFMGQVFIAVIEGTMFCIMIAVYFYLRLGVDVWPPPGSQLPHVTLPTLALIPLILSAAGSYWASEAAKKDSRSGMILGLLVNVILAGIFLVMRFVEWHSFNFNWATDVHGSVVWAIMGLHTLDLVSDVVFTIVLIVIVALGKHGEQQRLGVHVDSVVWYFLVLIWIPLYVVIYWGPHLVDAPQ